MLTAALRVWRMARVVWHAFVPLTAESKSHISVARLEVSIATIHTITAAALAKSSLVNQNQF
jgi:hypothetical protein